jgi:hypothetical protein
MMSVYITDMPSRAFIFTLGGALIGAGINAIYLFFTSRSAVEGRTS